MFNKPTCDSGVAICRVDDIDDDTVIGRVTPEGQAIAIYKIDGLIYATEDLCSHGAVALSGGFVDGQSIECPAHGGSFHIPTGSPICFPAQKAIRIIQVTVLDDVVYLKI